MNSRLDRDLSSTAVAQLNRLTTDANELKSRQSIGRSLVKRSYLAQSTSAFDVNGFSIAANDIHFFNLVYTGDKTQTYPYGVQFSQVYNGGTDAGHRLSDYQLQDATGTYYTWNSDGTYMGTNKMAWVIVVYAGSSGATVYLKARTMTTSGGSWVLTW